MLEKIKQFFSENNQPKKTVSEESIAPQLSVVEREKEIYGEDKISRQKLYEKWVCKDYWLLKTEGIYLLNGVEPGQDAGINETSRDSINELWQHAVDCVRKKMLTVTNQDAPEDQWQVMPADLYCWATVSRVEVPQELSMLMEFVLQTIKSKPSQAAGNGSEGQNSDQDNARYQRHKEITLGAAVSLLVNAPELCRSRSGKVKARLIAAEIMKHRDVWFDKEETALAQVAMEDLINRYIIASQNPLEFSGN